MEKKSTFFDKFNNLITKVGTIILMNLAFLLACVPVVTIGQAWAALLSALRYHIRGDKWFDGFKFGFKKRFLRGTIIWCIMLALAVFSVMDLWTYINGGAQLPAIIASGVMFAFVAMISVGLLVLNVYVPTDVANWLKNAVNMIFKAHIWVVLAAAVMWFPGVLAVFSPDLFALSVMVYFAAYYALAALLITLLLKNALIDFLVQARENGTLTAEEGKHRMDEDEYGEDDAENEEGA